MPPEPDVESSPAPAATAPPAAPEAKAPAAEVEDGPEVQLVGDPHRYTNVSGNVEKAGELTVIVGEFAGSIEGVEVRTGGELVPVDDFSVEEEAVGTARVTAKSKALTSGRATLRLTIPAD